VIKTSRGYPTRGVFFFNNCLKALTAHFIKITSWQGQRWKFQRQTQRSRTASEKRSFIDGDAEEADETAASRTTNKLYAITKKLSGRYSKPERPVNDKDNTNMGKELQLERCAEHFYDLLNRPSPQTTPCFNQASYKPIDCKSNLTLRAHHIWYGLLSPFLYI